MNYRNKFDIDYHPFCDFMDSYADYLDDLIRESISDYDDANFFDLLNRYDTPENLWDWYQCFEEDPLPVPLMAADE